MAFSQVLRGAQAPERVRVAISNPPQRAEPLDLSAVTAVSLSVTTPLGVVSWPATIVEQSANILRLEHVFALGDVEVPGAYHLLAVLTVPDGVRRAGPAVLNVT